jgi:hypothetical protein
MCQRLAQGDRPGCDEHAATQVNSRVLAPQERRRLSRKGLLDAPLVPSAPDDSSEARGAVARLALMRPAGPRMPDLDAGLSALWFLLPGCHQRLTRSAISEVAKRTVGVVLDPALEFCQRDQAPATAANDPELVQDVLLEEVDADAKRVRRLGLREREPRDG